MGLIHPQLDQSEDDNYYLETFHPAGRQFEFKERAYRTDQGAVPKNSAKYAAYLLWYTADVSPKWTYNAHKFGARWFNNISLLEKVILGNFVALPDVMRDLLGLYEWHNSCKTFYEKVKGTTVIAKGSFKDQNTIDILVSSIISFDHDAIKEKNIHESFSIIFDSPSDYNRCINNDIVRILSLKNDYSDKADELDQFIADPPSVFPLKISELEAESQGIQQDATAAVSKLMIKCLTRCYLAKQIYSDFDYFYEEQPDRIEGFIFTNLCIAATIFCIAKSYETGMDYEKRLYHLHQLVINIERKMFLQDFFYRVSKFDVIKLCGISLGIQMSNIIEWCLPKSLFTHGNIIMTIF